ncbi:MAG: hypothetical protein EOO63_13955 [Hymenobacter sp.]|nr:MAG: hypothetical protein EOO63_13955 [Hymenobacter sp.]
MKRKKQEPEGEKDVSAKTRSEVLADIQRFEKAGQPDELRGYLIQLSKWGEKPQQYENLFRGYLYAPEATLREAVVFALLYGLGLQKEEYRACAIEQLILFDEDDVEARCWAAFSLAHAYQGQRDKALLYTFSTILDDEREDASLKESIVRGILVL